MAEFELDGISYRSKKLDAFVQLNVARRLMPLVSSFKDAAEVMDQGERPAGVLDALEPIALAVAGLKDDDVNYIVAACLTAVDRQSGPGWQQVWNKAAGRAQFEDIQTNGYLMIRIAVEVIKDNVSNFFPGLLSASSGGAGVSEASTPSS